MPTSHPLQSHHRRQREFYQVEPFATHFTPLNILNPLARTALSLRRSPWPSLRQRSRTLASEVYAEAVGEVVAAAQKLIPAAVPGVPPLGARIGNLVLACIAFVVAVVGHVERLLNGGRVGGLAVNNIREASLPELQSGAGDLSDKRLLPSAYEVWDGPRPNGYLRVRYAYDVPKLQELLPDHVVACKPLHLDDETIEWMTTHIKSPCPTTRLHVWRALKRRLYHYDAGVVAFRGFPRNYLLSKDQWGELLGRGSGGGSVGSFAAEKAVALDIGAGDGSLNEPMRHYFSRVVATELTTPLVMRLRSVGLDGVLAEEPRAEWLGCDSFDAVLILNVLDRCKDPFQMLAQARSLLTSDGRLVVSVVLPASQSDAAASVGSSQRRWDVSGQDFETAAASLVNNVLVPSGFTPLRITRAPYFCAGDRFSPVAALDACVIVLKPDGAPGLSGTGKPEKSLGPGSTGACKECD